MLTINDHFFNLSGHVRHQGLALAGVSVQLFDLFSNEDLDGQVPLKEVKTGAKGDFSFSLKIGVYRIDVVPDATTRILKHSLPEVKVITNTNLNIGLSTGSIVSGTIKPFAAGSKPGKKVTAEMVAGTEVVALGIEPSSYKQVSSVDESGQFSLCVPRGKYHIALRCSQDQSAVDNAKIITTHSDVLTVDRDVDLVLEWPDLLTFKGEIVDVFGQPVDNAHIKVTPAASRRSLLLSELSFGAQTHSDSVGRFELALEPGSYDMNIESPPGSILFGAQLTDLTVAENTEQRFTLAEGHRLRGQVVFESALLSQSLIRVQSLESKQEYITRTDNEGNFSLSVPGGSYKLVAQAHPKDSPPIVIDGCEYSSLAPWSRNVVVGADTHVAIRLSEGTALKGRICDDSGQARPSVRVSAFIDQGAAPDATSSALVYGITDGEGNYCLFLSPGSYWLVVHKDFNSARRLEIGAEPVNEDIVWHGWSRIKFEVFGDDNQTVPRCQVFYHPYGSEGDGEESLTGSAPGNALNLPYGYVLTGDQGICRLTLPSGVYTFKFIPPQAGSFQEKVIRQLSISSDLTRKVTLEHKASGVAP